MSVANARLIATAPDMLDLLEDLFGYFEDNDVTDKTYWRDTIDKVLAKAEGSE